MDQAYFTDLQEALLYVFWPVIVWLVVLVITGGVFAALLSFAMEIFANRSQ